MYADKVMTKKRKSLGYFRKAATFGVEHAKVVIIVALLISLPATYIFLSSEPSYDFIGSMGNSESIQGMNAMTDVLGAGAIYPTQIVITGNTSIYNGTTLNYEYLEAVDNITAKIAADPAVQQVTSITRPFGALVDYRDFTSLSVPIQKQMLSDIGADKKSLIMVVIFKDQPEKESTVKSIFRYLGRRSRAKRPRNPS